jgi:hypothetical protein
MSRFRHPMSSLNFINLPNPSDHISSWDFTQPLIEMSTRDKEKFLGSKVRPMLEANNLTAICTDFLSQCGVLNILQLYRPLWPVTTIDSLNVAPTDWTKVDSSSHFLHTHTHTHTHAVLILSSHPTMSQVRTNQPFSLSQFSSHYSSTPTQTTIPVTGHGRSYVCFL